VPSQLVAGNSLPELAIRAVRRVLALMLLAVMNDTQPLALGAYMDSLRSGEQKRRNRASPGAMRIHAGFDHERQGRESGALRARPAAA